MCLRVTFGTKCEDEHRMSQKQEVHTGHKATVPLLPDRQHRGWRFPRLPVPMMQGHWTELRWLSCPSLKSSNVSKLLPQTTEEDVQRHGQACKQFTEDWLLRVPWTARRSNQSIIKEIGPGCSLEGMMLKLKLQYLGHLMQRVDSLEKTLMGRDWGQEEKGTTEDEMAGWPSVTRWTWVWVNAGSWWWTGRPGVLRFMGSQRVGHDWATELNWNRK